MLIPAPKPKASPEQLTLQDQLIAACKQGDEKTVKTLLEQGAKPDMANAKGEQPLGAAVWGICPDVVNALLKQTGGVALMTWKECEKHNMAIYKEIFIVDKFAPKKFKEWSDLLKKIDSSLFIRSAHLKKADDSWHNNDSANWDNWKASVELHANEWWMSTTIGRMNVIVRETEKEFAYYRSQIEQEIVKIASHSKVST